MGIMLGTVLLVTTLAPVFSEVEANGVRIRSHVRASVYTYELTNQGIGPIRCFEVPYGDGYYFQAPDGWHKDDEGGVFRAWTDEGFRAIRPGATGTFSFRVTSRGAVLGLVAARVERLSGETVVLSNVWGAVPEPRGSVMLVMVAVLAICGLHAWLAARTERCDSASA